MKKKQITKKQTKEQVKLQVAQDKFVKGLGKLINTFKSESGYKIFANYKVGPKINKN